MRWMRPVGAQFAHHPQGGKRVDRGARETEVALVEHGRHHAHRRSFHHPHLQAQAVQGDSQAGADQPAANDQYIVRVRHAAMISPHRWALR